jgi:hypothetical protein
MPVGDCGHFPTAIVFKLIDQGCQKESTVSPFSFKYEAVNDIR